MIISRTPYRVSLMGGSTDYREWFKHNPGAVLSTTIDKYCYVTARRLPPFFDHKTRAVWSQIENVRSNADIAHPAIRACLEFMEMEDGLEIHCDGDLPARSGIGSSASFTVGLLHALYGLKSQMVAKRTLALAAMEVDQDISGENVGCQDHVAAAFGGFNRIDFYGNRGDFAVRPAMVNPARLRLLESHLLLFYTRFSRTASDVAADMIANVAANAVQLARMREMVDEGMEILAGDGSIAEFGRLLHDSWMLKRGLAQLVTNERIDHYYNVALKSGAIGGKILGAGGGGHLLVFAEPRAHGEIRDALWELVHVPFKFENAGSQIVYYAEDH